MSLVSDLYIQAELALASYSNLTAGISDNPYIDALKNGGDGMSDAQASDFASKWTVVDQFNSITGVSATIFQENATGQKYLAIRGTQDPTDYLADYFILNGTPSELNPQYQALKTQVQAWLSNGTLTVGFTVSGHSLGGYLAAGLLADFDSNISHAYLYNAPGNNSTISLIAQALGWSNTPDSSKITSLRADAGISPIADLGSDFSPPTSIAIENQFLDGVSNPPPAMNHSQQVLTDSLALYQVFAQLVPDISVSLIGEIFKKSSNENKLTLEKTLDALRILVLGKSIVDAMPTVEGDRNSFFANLVGLQNSDNFESLIGKVVINPPAANASDARDSFGDFLSLYFLTPFSIYRLTEGAENTLKSIHPELAAAWEADNQLTSEQIANGEANFSDMYLNDRAAMLRWIVKRNS